MTRITRKLAAALDAVATGRTALSGPTIEPSRDERPGQHRDHAPLPGPASGSVSGLTTNPEMEPDMSTDMTYRASIADGTDDTMEAGVLIQEYRDGDYTGTDIYVGPGVMLRDPQDDGRVTAALTGGGWELAEPWVYSGGQYMAEVRRTVSAGDDTDDADDDD